MTGSFPKTTRVANTAGRNEPMGAPISQSTRDAPQALLQLRVSAHWQSIEAFRQFLEVYARNRFTSRVAERIGTATQELLENAANYCSITADISFELRHLPAAQRLEIRVSNESVPSRITALTRRISELKSRDPQEVYQDALRSVSSPLSLRAMLGLARVRCEADMELEATVDGNRVTVIASGRD